MFQFENIKKFVTDNSFDISPDEQEKILAQARESSDENNIVNSSLPEVFGDSRLVERFLDDVQTSEHVRTAVESLKSGS